jgi:hypothetical protein
MAAKIGFVRAKFCCYRGGLYDGTARTFHRVRADEKRGAWVKLTGAPLVYSNNSYTSGITSFSAGTPTNDYNCNEERVNFEEEFALIFGFQNDFRGVALYLHGGSKGL